MGNYELRIMNFELRILNEGYKCGTSMPPMCYSGREMVAKPAVNFWDAGLRHLDEEA